MNLADASRIITAGLSMLPPKYSSQNAVAMLLAIGLQESGFTYRRQMADGPARGWWQFEKIGVKGVLTHNSSADDASACCLRLGYQPTVGVHEAIEHNDILAVIFARLALWSIPEALAGPDDPEDAWAQYLRAWRPGKPHPATWEQNYKRAWEIAG